VQITNKRSVWDMHPDGTYVQRRPGPNDDPHTVQEILIDLAERRLAASSPVKKKKKPKKSRKGRSGKRN
jgi:polyphosphate kinase